MAEVSIESRAELEALERRDEDLPAYDLRPERPRVVGPGRREREYQRRLGDASAALDGARRRERELREELREGRAALEVSQRIEHGCQRRIDRLEDRLEERTQALLESERQQKRLALALGSMQREVEALRAQALLALREAPARTGFWRRILGRGRR